MIFIPETFRGFDYRDLLERVRPDVPSLRDVVVVRSGGHDGLRWEDAIACDPAAELPTLDPAAVMMVMYTSGTTSRPKGVLHSHQTYGFKVRHMGDTWKISDTDVAFMPSPMTHITGAFWCVDLPWERGASAVLMDVWSAEEGLRCIETHGCTISAGATPFLQQLLEFGGARPEAVRSLRLFSCGGTTVSPDLIRKATAAFPWARFFRAYGSTEAPTTSMGGFDGATPQLNAETDGAILPPTEVKIVSEAGEVLGEDEEGEILVRGPEVFLGYLNVPNGGDFDAEGFFRTGDLGRRVAGRHLVITGRKKDIIIRSGENISPKEVEDILHEHPDIQEVAIVAMPSPATGEKGCAFIVPRAGAPVDLPTIRAFLETAKVARQKFPEHVVVVEELPHVPSGKVRKDVLRAEAQRIAATL
jgi:acyl-CoA synthetase (AMP-forming)/AMP-acid ligase II